MTNQQKYRSMSERAAAFRRFCAEQDNCKTCPADYSSCYFSWREMEAPKSKEQNNCETDSAYGCHDYFSWLKMRSEKESKAKNDL